MSLDNQAPIDEVVIRMYRMGTGDCFVVKFKKGGTDSFKMLIDCGCWNGTKQRLAPYLKELMKDVENHVHVLVVTHEHRDHVLGFEQGEKLFTNGKFKVDQIWMAWTENDNDSKIKRWKRSYGQKKKVLAAAAEKLQDAVKKRGFRNQFEGSREQNALYEGRRSFAAVLNGFAELHAAKRYVGPLAGMTVVKEKIQAEETLYFEPGDIIENRPGLEGVRILVLGPPKSYLEVKVEEGPEGEAYEHNDRLEDTDAFAVAFPEAIDAATFPEAIDAAPAPSLPFAESYVTKKKRHRGGYNDPNKAWRRIDHDWLFSAGSLALRMNTRTNNLSLVLAIEFIKSEKVLLFPGDAEFGSWKSWHKIPWKAKVPKLTKLTTEKLLNRVVFYKVAHHLSHHGTAGRVGLDMMTSPDLVAMATLDYGVIPSGWKSTMPNAAILKDLLEKTKGRLEIMNTKGLLFDRKEEVPLAGKIEEYQKRMSKSERDAYRVSRDDDGLYTEIVLDI